MPNTYFRFKQFTVHHERCAMKVGTDGTLLGAWVGLQNAQRVLDIGTGTGLIALMCAQRMSALGCSSACIKAVDVEPAAVEQALANVAASPWHAMIEVEQCNILNYVSDTKFDTIVCNPPFFVNSLQCPDDCRTSARHTSSLPFDSLLTKVKELLAPDGCFSVVLPADICQSFIQEAIQNALYLCRRTDIQTLIGKEVKRVLLSFGHQNITLVQDKLLIELERGIYSEAYKELTRDFYLKF